MNPDARSKPKSRTSRAVFILDPKTEMAAAVTKTGRSIHRRITMLDALGFFALPAEAAARHKKQQRRILETALAELEPRK